MNPRLGLCIRIGVILFLLCTALVAPIVAGTDYGPSLFTGSASYVIPIQTLPGKGVGPSLALQYDSGGGKSAYGWGWSLIGGGEISRVGRGFHRIPSFVDIDNPSTTTVDERDVFRLAMGGMSSDLKQKSLVTGNSTDDNYYLPLDEMFVQIHKEANGWKVSGPDGTTYWFLEPIYRVNPTSQNFTNARAWALSWVINSDGYSMKFTYDIDTAGGDYYLRRVDYSKLISGTIDYATLMSGPSIILDTKRSVEFNWVSRGPNNTIASYATGSKVEMDQRLDWIKVFADRDDSSSLYRTYTFSFSADNITAGASNWITPESKLIKVESFGIPTTCSPTCTSPLFQRWAFEYTPRTAGWGPSTGETLPYILMEEKATYASTPPIVFSGDLGVRWAELNGNPFSELLEGRQDMVYPPPGCPPGSEECFAEPTSTRSARSDQGPPPAGGANVWMTHAAPPVDFAQRKLEEPGDPVDDLGVFMEDLDGDGDTDMLKLCDSAPREVWVYNAGSWQRSTTWESQLPADALDSWSCGNGWATRFTRFAELNGDSCPDMILQRWYNSDPVPLTWVAYNPCTSGQPWEVTATGLAQNLPTNFQWGTFVDLNGDGLADWTKSERYIPTFQSSYSGASSGTCINTGSSWLCTGNPFDAGLISAGAAGTVYFYDSAHVKRKMEGDLQIADVNGDGFADVLTNDKVLINHQNAGFISVCAGATCPPLKLINNYPSNNSNPPSGGSPSPFMHSGRTGTDVIDLKGNGLPGYVHALKKLNGSTEYAVHPANGQAPALLSRVTQPSGASVQFTYDMSWKSPNSRIPSAMPVLKSMTVDDSAGGWYPTTYSYSDGWFDLATQQFRGFGVVEATSMDGIRTRTTFHQKDPLKGQVSKSELIGPDSFKYSEEQHFYTTDGQAPPDCSSNPTNLDCAVPYFNPETRTTSTSCEPGSGTTCLTNVVTTAVSFEDGGAIHNGPDDRVASIETRLQGEPNNVTPIANQLIKRVEYKSNTTTNWIVGQVARESIFRADDTMQPVRTTSYIYDKGTGVYDSTQSWNDAPLSSRIVRTRVEAVTDPFIPTSPALPPLDTQAAYDTTFKHPIWTKDPPGVQFGYQTDFLYESDVDHAANIYITKVRPPAVNGRILESTSHYDKFGRVKSSQDANGFVNETQYDAFDRAIRVLRKNSSTTLAESKMEYLGFCDSTCAPFPAQTTVLNPQNQRIRRSIRQYSGQSEAQWPWSESYLDGLGRGWMTKNTTLDGAGPGVVTVSSEQIFDVTGRPWMASPPYTSTRPDPAGGLWSEIQYDLIGRPIENRAPLTLPDGTVTVRTRQERRIAGETTGPGVVQHRFEMTAYDTEDRSKRYWDDVFGRRYQVTEYPSSGTSHWIRHSYDPLGNLMQTVDDMGTVLMVRAYDGQGRIRTESDQDAGLVEYGYDNVGRTFSAKDAKNNRLELTYDALGRLTDRKHIPATGSEYHDQYEYDSLGGITQGASLGQLVRRADTAGTFLEIYSYQDPAGRLNRRTTTILGQSKAFDYTYNDSGAVVDLIYDALGSSETVHYDYSTATGQLLQMTSPIAPGANHAYVDSIVYDPLGRMRSFRFGNDVVTTRTYNDSGDQLLSEIHAAKGSANLLGLQYQRNLRGLLSRITDTVGSVEARYQYDDLGRLHVGEEYTIAGGTATLTQQRVFEYDARGRMLSLSGPYQPFMRAYDGSAAVTPPPTQTLTFQYRGNSGCTVAPPTTPPLHGPCGDTVFQYEYDANGALERRIRRGGTLQTAFTFNDRHRLSREVDEQQVPTDLYYDTEGNLIARTRNGQTDRYFGLIEAFGTSSQRQYFLGGTRIATRTGSNAPRFLHADDLGSVRVISNETSGAELRRDYYEFGAIETASGVDTDRARAYAGLRWDPAGEGYDAGARDYPASRPMFLSPDAIPGHPDSPQSYNRFAYALNDPINLSDPSGYRPQHPQIISDQPEPMHGGISVGKPGSIAAGLLPQRELFDAFDSLRLQYESFMRGCGAACGARPYSPGGFQRPVAPWKQSQPKIINATRTYDDGTTVSLDPVALSRNDLANATFVDVNGAPVSINLNPSNTLTCELGNSINVVVQAEILSEGIDWWQAAIKSSSSVTIDPVTGEYLSSDFPGFTPLSGKLGTGPMSSTAMMLDGYAIFGFTASVGPQSPLNLLVTIGMVIDLNLTVVYDPSTGHGLLSGTRNMYPSLKVWVNGGEIYNYFQGWNGLGGLWRQEYVNQPF